LKRYIKVVAVVLGVVSLSVAAVACGDDDSSDSGSTPAAATTAAPAVTAPAEQPNVAEAAPAVPGSGKGLKIGYISNLESVPIVHTISESIREQAERSGADFVFCDGAGDTSKALDCAKSFKTQNVQGILNFQHDAAAAPSICAAGPDVPTIAIDIPQKPCQIAFMGVDNAYGGFVAGKLIGDYYKENFDCKYDAWVSLEQPEIGKPNDDRLGGYREGFASVCGPVTDVIKEGFDASAEGGRAIMADVLTTLPGKHNIIVVSIDDEGIEGAFAAAKAAGREKDIWAGSLGVADDVAKCGIKTNPNWLAATAISPEKYGWVGVPNIIKAIKGEEVNPELFVPLVAVNSETITDLYPDLTC
jgi:ribose transport system substrate-binding protein